MKKAPKQPRPRTCSIWVRGFLMASLIGSVAMNVAQYRGVFTNPANLTYQVVLAKPVSEDAATIFAGGR